MLTPLLVLMSVFPSLAADLPPPNVLVQGNGWQRLLEPLPGALGTQSAECDIVVVNSFMARWQVALMAHALSHLPLLSPKYPESTPKMPA